MTETNLTLSGMKAQMNKTKKRNLSVSKEYREKQKAAQKAMKVSTDVKPKAKKAAKEKAVTPKAPKISFDSHEADIAKMLGFELNDQQIKDKMRRTGTKGNVQLVSMPERKELVIKVNGVTVCELYPRPFGTKICTREKFISQVKLPENVKSEHHEKWDMTESFNLQKNEMANVLKQFMKLTTKIQKGEN